MSKYKSVPDNINYLEVCPDWCGHEQCNCHHIDIYGCELNSGKGIHLYETSWWDGYDIESIRQAAKEIMAACDHYGIKYNVESLERDCIWDWEFETLWLKSQGTIGTK